MAVLLIEAGADVNLKDKVCPEACMDNVCVMLSRGKSLNSIVSLFY